MKTRNILLGAMLSMLLVLQACHINDTIDKPHIRRLVNETTFDLEIKVFGVDDSMDSLKYEMQSGNVINLEGSYFSEHIFKGYEGLGWMWADSASVILQDSLFVKYLYPEFCPERNPLILPKTDGCGGYEFSESGDTTIWTFTFTEADFTDAEVLRD